MGIIMTFIFVLIAIIAGMAILPLVNGFIEFICGPDENDKEEEVEE